MKHNRNSLSKVLGRTDVLAIGFGTMVGWGWIMLATTWLTKAGFWGTITAFLIGALVFLGIGAVYGELTSAMPCAGGEVAYIYRAMGGKAAGIVGWILSFAYLGVAAWEGIAIATALDFVLPIGLYVPLWDIAGYTVHLSWALVGMLGAVIMMLLNLFSSRSAVLFQVIATAAVVMMVLMVFFGGITFGNIKNIGEGFHSLDGFFYVLLMVPSMLIGFNVIALSAEEMNLPPRETGKMVMVCIGFSVVWYILMIVGLAFCAPVEVRMSGIIPAVDAVSYAFRDDTFGSVLILGGILGVLTSWNGFFMGATRMIYFMGRVKMLPEVFGRLHPKYHSPWAATILVGSVCMGAPLLGKNALIWFVDISSFCTLLAYSCVCLSFVILRKKEPELYRPFKVPLGTAFGVIITGCSVIYLVIYIQNTITGANSAVQMILPGIWIFAGIGLVLWARKDFGLISTQERELLFFGEKLARRKFL